MLLIKRKSHSNKCFEGFFRGTKDTWKVVKSSDKVEQDEGQGAVEGEIRAEECKEETS